ncbi:MAG: hypothetical protein ABI771_02195 [Betaproteobacteria bacterium]
MNFPGIHRAGLESVPVKLALLPLRGRSLFSRRPAAGGGGPVVSMTTYGKRLETAFFAIESIARGSLLPSRLILWIDETDVLARLPLPLRRLQERGLEILPTSNFGPHKKYFPYVQASNAFDRPLVTADDDVIYPQDWLEGLQRAYDARGDLIHCYRANVVKMDGDGFAPYRTWGRCSDTGESFLNFATGVSGILYPPEFLAYLKRQGNGFLECCPRADDVWLHAAALRSGVMIKQVTSIWTEYPSIPDTQDVALANTNLFGTGNDLQIGKTYLRQDVERLILLATRQ